MASSILTPRTQKTCADIGFLSNTGPDHLKNHKATKLKCWAIIGTPAKRHLMVFRWQAIDGPLIVVKWYLDPSSPHQLGKRGKNVIKVGPPLTKLSGSAHGRSRPCNIKIQNSMLGSVSFR